MYGYVYDNNTQVDLYGLDVYGLYTTANGWYPVYTKGSATPTSYQFMKEGELYKIGESQNSSKRYSGTKLDEGRIHSKSKTGGKKYKGVAVDTNGKVRLDANGNTFDAGLEMKPIGPQGKSKQADRLSETQKINDYKNKNNGMLPPGNKTFH
ncbi:hypothetical protein A5M85_03860 [Cellulophaga lytica]|nr:hypothetical protein A5M85_03860 [Cellulophaga lytica]